MMNLDDDNYAPPPIGIPDDPDGAIVCPTCGTTEWDRREYGTYHETLYITTDHNGYRDYGDQDQNYEGNNGWHCAQGHPATDATLDLIDTWLEDH